MKFADIALNTKSSNRNDLFTYNIPSELMGGILVGQMVIVSFANRKANGIVIKIHDKKPDFETKNIEKIIDPIPLINEKQIELARFISDYYWAGMGQVVFSFLPTSLRKRKTKVFKEKDCYIATLSHCQNKTAVKNSNITIQQCNNLTLTLYQEKSLQKIFDALESKAPKTFLLHGVTNSGKTEVYLRSFAKALENGGGGIYIVPEISLTPQAVERFEKVFGKDQVALVHSKLSIAQRLKAWVDIKTGKKKVVIGSRSAIFAPLSDLKLIIIDEEHDIVSFKSDQTPRYELHAVAEKLSELVGATLVFGTATPLVTSYKKVLDGKWDYLSLPERIDGAPLPKIKIVDMEKERMSRNQSLFSESMVEALGMVLRNKKQALLFLNRRGTASFIICETCKKVSMCQDCNSALVYHSSDNRLWCHHCSRKYQVPDVCSSCKGVSFRYLGKGTERIEAEIKKIFPQVIVARMDRDTMTGEAEYQNIFNNFKNGKIDILVGTQMIVHGWDVPNVDFAGIISIDESLLIPDYGSDEKVFQLITQLAGRTGRGGARGLMILQTFYPEHHVFRLVENGDFANFVKEELKMRKMFSYPPYSQVIKLGYGGVNKEIVDKKAEDLVGIIKNKIASYENNNIEIIGPVSPLIEKKFGRYWKNIIIKFSIYNSQPSSLKPIRDDILNIVPREWVVDIDPLNIL